MTTTWMRRLGMLAMVALLVLGMGCAGTTQRGRASYYGGKFHGRATASGERFDKEAMTAAHKDLKFGTRVRVTNPENGRSVVVRVNDRFPGTKGRIIDLSEGAFRRLAPLERGVIDVEIEILE
jgi:rare lipoprotein A